MRIIFRLICLSVMFFGAGLSAQTIVTLENFNSGSLTPAQGSWIGHVTTDGSTITTTGGITGSPPAYVGALDDQGWGRSGLNINGTGTLVFQVTAQLSSTNVAPFIVLQMTDSGLSSVAASLSTSLFNTTSFTTANSGAFTLVNGTSFDFGSITSWTFGGGSTGINALNITFDNLALAVPEPSTYALLALGLGVVALPILRRRRS